VPKFLGVDLKWAVLAAAGLSFVVLAGIVLWPRFHIEHAGARYLALSSAQTVASNIDTHLDGLKDLLSGISVAVSTNPDDRDANDVLLRRGVESMASGDRDDPPHRDISAFKSLTSRRGRARNAVQPRKANRSVKPVPMSNDSENNGKVTGPHRFKKGDKRPAKAGRRKGTPNRISVAMRDAVVAAAELAGEKKFSKKTGGFTNCGPGGLTGYMLL
jgi:hypothetical protein